MVRTASSPLPSHKRIPPLENGDHLTRDEFERRYEAMEGLTKAELIEGIVYVAPPALRWDHHAGPHADLMAWLGWYRAATEGVRVGDNASIRMDLENMPQPDAAMIIEPRYGGNAKIGNDDYLEGAPEFVGEIAGSSASIDLNQKMRVYRLNGVREYLVWRVEDQSIDWFVLREGAYERLTAHEDGITRSIVFPGLWLDAAAMIRGEMGGVLQVLQRGLATSDHAAFAAELKSRRGGV